MNRYGYTGADSGLLRDEMRCYNIDVTSKGVYVYTYIELYVALYVTTTQMILKYMFVLNSF